jgi:hypothetical protein
VSKIEDIRLNVEDCAANARVGFESIEQLRIESSFLDDAEKEVGRAYRDMYAGTKEAEDWVCEQVVNHPRLSQVILLAMSGDRWQAVMQDILSDAMSSFAERNIHV